MKVLTITKSEDGSESYDINDKIIEMFKDKPENLKLFIDAIKEKDVKLAKEETNQKKEETDQKKEETKQSGFENIGKMVVAGCKSINLILEGIKEIKDSLDPNENSLSDDRSNEQVAKDVKENYVFANGEINL